MADIERESSLELAVFFTNTVIDLYFSENVSWLDFKKERGLKNEAFSSLTVPIRSIYGLCVTSTRSIAGEQSFVFDLNPFLFPSSLSLSLSLFSFLLSFFFTIDRICLALSDTHTRINPFYPVARADRNSLHDDDLSAAWPEVKTMISVHRTFLFFASLRFMFSRDLGGKDDSQSVTNDQKSNGPVSFFVARRNKKASPIFPSTSWISRWVSRNARL